MLDVVLAGHNTLIAGAAGIGSKFQKGIKKAFSVTNTTGRAAKVFKNKARRFHSFGDCHEPKEIVYVVCLHVLSFLVVFLLFQKNKTSMSKYIGAPYWCIRT